MLHSLPHPGAQPPRPVPAGMPYGNEARAVPTVSPGGGSAFGDDGLTFGDVLDVINPLHHVPLLGNVYRKLSGDTIAPAARIGGGALFGGPFGAAVAAATVVAGSIMGRDGGAPADAGKAVPRGAAPGGWMVAAGRPVRAPALAVAAAPAAEKRGALAATRQPARGGWMVAAARAAPPPAASVTGDRTTDVVASAEPPPVRRGGWMVAAAYAVTDSMWREDSDARRQRLDALA